VEHIEVCLEPCPSPEGAAEEEIMVELATIDVQAEMVHHTDVLEELLVPDTVEEAMLAPSPEPAIEAVVEDTMVKIDLPQLPPLKTTQEIFEENDIDLVEELCDQFEEMEANTEEIVVILEYVDIKLPLPYFTNLIEDINDIEDIEGGEWIEYTEEDSNKEDILVELDNQITLPATPSSLQMYYEEEEIIEVEDANAEYEECEAQEESIAFALDFSWLSPRPLYLVLPVMMNVPVEDARAFLDDSIKECCCFSGVYLPERDACWMEWRRLEVRHHPMAISDITYYEMQATLDAFPNDMTIPEYKAQYMMDQEYLASDLNVNPQRPEGMFWSFDNAAVKDLM